MSRRTRRATLRPHGLEILRFHAPLALNGLLLALAGPVLNLVIARAADPSPELAGFWIAFTVLLLAQSAAVALQPVAVALAPRRGALMSLVAAASISAAAGTGALLILATTPAGGWFFRDVIPCTPAIAARARDTLAALSGIPPLVALRSLAAGRVVSERRTHLVAATTVIRIALLALGAGVIVWLGLGAGALAAARLFMIGMLADTLFLAAMAWRAPRRSVTAQPRGPVALREIVRIGGPLALATLAWTATRGMVHAALARLGDAALAQADFGIVLPLLMVSCAPLWALLELGLVLPRSARSFWRVAGFAAMAALAISTLIALVTWTPFGLAALAGAFRLTPGLRRDLNPVLGLLALAPPLVAARALAQAVLIHARATGVMLMTAPARLALLLICGLGAARAWPGMNGAALALTLLLASDAMDAAALSVRAAAACRAAGGLDRVLRGRSPRPAASGIALPAPVQTIEPGEAAA